MDEPNCAHQSLKEAEKSIAVQFRIETAPDIELTQNYQEAIDGMQNLLRKMVQGVLENLTSNGKLNREWELVESVVSELEAFRTEVRGVLGEGYLVGGIFIHVKTYHNDWPATLCFTIHKADSADAEFDALICADANSEFPTLSRGYRSSLRLPGDPVPIRKRPFSEDMLEWLK